MSSALTVELDADRLLRPVQREIGEPGSGQVLLDVSFCGICGSDLHFRDVPEVYPVGTVPGHETAGSIAALGPGVEAWQVGDRVAVLPFGQCGRCETCLRGDEHLCPRRLADGVGFGTGRPGGYSDRMIVDERMLFALPDEVDDRAGALSEPLAVAVHAIGRAAIAHDDPILVIGGGPIGLLTALALHAEGFERCALVSRNASRAEHARNAGVTAIGLEEATADGVAAVLGDAPAVVFECAGTPAAARLAVELVRPLGSVVLSGISLEPLDLDGRALVVKEVDLRGAMTYRRSDFARAIELLAGGAIPTAAVVTQIAPLDEAEAMFQALSASGNTQVKVLLHP